MPAVETVHKALFSYAVVCLSVCLEPFLHVVWRPGARDVHQERASNTPTLMVPYRQHLHMLHDNLHDDCVQPRRSSRNITHQKCFNTECSAVWNSASSPTGKKATSTTLRS